MRRALEAIVFDFDGTIAETERLGHRVAYNIAFAQSGLDWVWDDALYGAMLKIAGGKERIAHYLDRYRADDEAIADRPAFIARLHARKQQAFSALVETIDFRPGVKRLVREAKSAGVKLAIATTAARAGVDALLGRDPLLSDAFDLIAAGDVIPNKKPAPDIYNFTLEGLGVAARNCVAVEDAAIGLRAARAAGIATLVTVSDYTRGEDFSGAAAVVGDLGEADRHADVIAGPPTPSGVVDLSYLRTLLQSAR
jgi:HAD superfamily hydrolase (TIGR01509 family)